MDQQRSAPARKRTRAGGAVAAIVAPIAVAVLAVSAVLAHHRRPSATASASDTMRYWLLISRFGDASLLLPCAVLLLIWLCHRGQLRAARAWSLAFVAATMLTLGSKLAFAGWGIGIPALDFAGFSGHSMMAAGVLPVLLHSLAPARCARCGWVAGMLGVLVALLIGYSRLPLGAHSPSEVVGGLVLGLAASASYLRGSVPAPRAPVPTMLTLALAALWVAMPVSRAHAPTQQWVERIALLLSGHERPFLREDWQRRKASRETAAIGEPAVADTAVRDAIDTTIGTTIGAIDSTHDAQH